MGKRRVRDLYETMPDLPSEALFREEQEREKECISKSTYYTENEAEDASLMARMRSGENIRPYKCKFCDNFHIGHKY